jgi:hypothetical protein
MDPSPHLLPPAGTAGPLVRAAWPEFFRDQPTVLFPGCAGSADWPGPEADLRVDRDWSAVLDGQALVVTAPGGRLWFEGLLPATRQWRRAARTRGTVLQVCGAFVHPAQVPAYAAAGALQVLAVPFTLVGRL